MSIRHALRRALFERLTTVDPVGDRAGGAIGRGRPVVRLERWDADAVPTDVCPSGALSLRREESTGHEVLALSYAACVFCGLCAEASKDGAIEMEAEDPLPVRSRGALVSEYDLTARRPLDPDPRASGADREPRRAAVLGVEQLRVGRSLHVLTVDAGSCNGCDVEIAALLNPLYDLERLGIHLTTSPRQADVLLVTGVVARHMERAVRRVYDAVPDPKVVMAAGACGCSGGIFRGSYCGAEGVDRVIPVDVYVPGCPPRPRTLLHGLLLAAVALSERLTIPHRPAPTARATVAGQADP